MVVSQLPLLIWFNVPSLQIGHWEVTKIYKLVGGFKYFFNFPVSYMGWLILPIDSYIFKMVIAPPSSEDNITSLVSWWWWISPEWSHAGPSDLRSPGPGEACCEMCLKCQGPGAKSADDIELHNFLRVYHMTAILDMEIPCFHHCSLFTIFTIPITLW